MENLESLKLFLNKKRKLSAFLIVLFIVLSSLFGAAGFPLLTVGVILVSDFTPQYVPLIMIIFGAISFFALLPTFLLLIFKIQKDYRNLFSSKLSTLFLKDKYEGATYSYKGNETKVQKLFKDTPFKTKNKEPLGLIEGKIGAASFVSFSFPRTVPIDFKLFLGPAWNATMKRPKALYGLYVKFDFDFSFPHPLLIQKKGKISSFKQIKLKTELTSESLYFNNEYRAYSDDILEGTKRLTPPILSAINHLNELYHGFLNIYVNKNHAYVCFDYYFTGFYFSTFKKVTHEYIDLFKNELLLPWHIFSLLNGFK